MEARSGENGEHGGENGEQGLENGREGGVNDTEACHFETGFVGQWNNDNNNVNSGAILESMHVLMGKVEKNRRMLNEVFFDKPDVGYDTGWAFRCFGSMSVAAGLCSDRLAGLCGDGPMGIASVHCCPLSSRLFGHAASGEGSVLVWSGSVKYTNRQRVLQGCNLFDQA